MTLQVFHEYRCTSSVDPFTGMVFATGCGEIFVADRLSAHYCPVCPGEVHCLCKPCEAVHIMQNSILGYEWLTDLEATL